MVEFKQQTGNEFQVYTLYFGDNSVEPERIDDSVATNNGDAKKVMATVVEIVKDFLNDSPDVIIYFEARDNVRARLYRMTIGARFESLIESFAILGSVGDDWEAVMPNKTYDSYLAAKMSN